MYEISFSINSSSIAKDLRLRNILSLCFVVKAEIKNENKHFKT